jgi:hypothetical protein
MTARTIEPALAVSRREFLRIGVPVALTLSAGAFPLVAAPEVRVDKGAKALARLKGASIAKKVKLLQEV